MTSDEAAGDMTALFEAVTEPVVIHDLKAVLWGNAAARHLVGSAVADLAAATVASRSIVHDGRPCVAAVLEPSRARLEQQQRIELLALISAGLAHDLSNPLAVMALQLGAQARDLHALKAVVTEEGLRDPVRVEQAFADCRRGLESLEDVSQFVTRVVRDFSRLSRGGEATAPQTTDVRHAVEVAARFTRGLISSRARTELIFEVDGEVRIPESSLVRVLMNLIVNAAQAFASDAPVTNRIRVRVGRAAGGIVVDVIDNGGGIAAANVASLFTPFARRRETKNAGLGLPVARALLREHGGDLELVETGPRGTTFRCRIPTGGRS